ncbi:MAG: glycosyl transferase family 2, partial [Bacteroidota bacterium]
NMTFLPQDEIAEVDALSGSCMMVRHAALYLSREEAIRRALTNGTATGDSVRATEGTSGAGLFDEDFFMYGEDLDWCYRIQQAGWKIFYTPETRIIHFKGESTKKGELRYVRLFYGAMVKFAQKHFDSRYSWSFTLAIRSAILARATLGVGARLMRRLSQPILEASLVFLTVSILGASLLGYPADAVPALFYGSVAGGFSLIFLAAATLGGAYRRAQRRRLKPVWKGLATALILLAALSFFIKDIAYSRLLLLTSFLSSGVMLSAVRLSIRNPRSNGDCRVLLVGDAQETSRLEHLLAGQPSPPFILVGYVSPDESEEADSSRESLGPARQLRDIVRLHRIDDVVFASRCVSNFDIFRWMQQLHDLPVQFRILAAEPDRIIGKSSIDEFVEPPLISAHEALHSPRSRLARRAFEVPVALTGLLLLPVVRLAASATSASHPLRHLARKTGMLGSVVTGSRALVGYDSSAGFIPPIEWNLKPGVFSVTDTMSRRPDGPDDLLNAYWFYTQHQSASMDWDIILKCLRSANR